MEGNKLRELIKTRLEEKGMKQKDLASQLGYTPSYICDEIKNGKFRREAVARATAMILDIPWDEWCEAVGPKGHGFTTKDLAFADEVSDIIAPIHYEYATNPMKSYSLFLGKVMAAILPLLKQRILEEIE